MFNIKEGQLRVWEILNVPNDPNYYFVETIEEAMKVIRNKSERALKSNKISSSVYGLEVFENGDWCEWYDEEGNDIDYLLDEQEA